MNGKLNETDYQTSRTGRKSQLKISTRYQTFREKNENEDEISALLREKMKNHHDNQ